MACACANLTVDAGILRCVITRLSAELLNYPELLQGDWFRHFCCPLN